MLDNLIKNLSENRSAKKPVGYLGTVLLPVLLVAEVYGTAAMAQEQATATSAKEQTTILAENEKFHSSKTASVRARKATVLHVLPE